MRTHHTTTRILLALITMFAACAARSHELEENSATLVLREPHHVSLTLFIDVADALHHALAPQRPFQEFALAYAALSPADFKAALLRAERRFEAETVVAPGGAAPSQPFQRWAWPEPAKVQAVLRERAMQSLVAPAEHVHGTHFEVHAELRAATPIEALRVSFPAAYERVLLVSYQPRQTWVEARQPSPMIKF